MRSMYAHLARPVVASFVIAFGAAAFAQAPRFTPSGFRPLHETRRSAVADFDGDGRIDIVASTKFTVANFVASELELWRGDGFGGYARVQTVPLAGDVTALTIADLDDDGRPDVVAAQAEIAIPVWSAYEVQANGMLAFVGGAPAGGGVKDVACADVDGDGDLEVVCANQATNRLSISFGAGGVFTTPSTFGVGFAPAHVELADFNGDGNVDFAVAGSLASIERLRVFFGDGAGGWTSHVDLASTVSSNGVLDLVAGDLDGDADADLVMCGLQAQVFENLGTSFAAPVAFDAAPKTRPLARIADVDDDGDVDLVLANGQGFFSYVDVASNDGSGGFSTPAQVYGLFSSPRDLAVIDANGDGRDDLVMLDSQKVCLALASAPAVFQNPPAVSPPGHSFGGAAYGDIDGDGDRDVLRHDGLTSQYVVFTNSGAGTLVDTASFFSSGVTYSMELADLDGDALPELFAMEAIGGYMKFIWRKNLGGTFGATQVVAIPPTMSDPSSFTIGDLDADGDNDVIVHSGYPNVGFTVYRNIAGTLNVAQTNLTFVFKPKIADIDVDGIPDIVSVVGTTTTIAYFPGMGGCLFSASPLNIGSLTGLLEDFEFGDLNNDGRLDIAFMTSMVLEPGLLGAFVFTTGMNKVVKQQMVPVGVDGLRLGDLDADGTLDALCASDGTVGFMWMHGVGDGSFAPESSVHINGVPIGGADIANYDADADLEIVVGRFGTTPQLMLQPGCIGAAAAFGHGCVGAGGFTPRMSLAGCVSAGQTLQWKIDHAVGGSVAVVLFGVNPVADAFGTACSLQVAPLFPASLVVPLAGVGAGNGLLDVAVLLPPSLAPGSHFAIQAACADPSLPWGYTVTNPVEVVAD